MSAIAGALLLAIRSWRGIHDRDFPPDLESIIRARDFSALRRKLENWEPANLAGLMISLPVEDQVIVFRILPHGLAAGVFEYLDFAAQELLLKTMAPAVVATLSRNWRYNPLSTRSLHKIS